MENTKKTARKPATRKPATRKPAEDTREWVSLLENNDDVAVTVTWTKDGGYGTLRSGPVDVRFSIFMGADGYYALFPSYKKPDGTYKKLVYLSEDLYNALDEYINI